MTKIIVILLIIFILLTVLRSVLRILKSNSSQIKQKENPDINKKNDDDIVDARFEEMK